MSLLPTLLGSTTGGGGGGSSVPGVILAPVVAASTAALNATYANGSSGQGATLTNGSATLTAARVATTGALTVTYSNGTLGVGATLTNNGTQAAISIDSVALSLNDRVLVKNQAAPAQNGVYSVTTVGTGSTNWVLTRVTDFDQAAEMIAGTQINITAGTTNVGTEWILSTTIATVGTDAVTFVATAAFSIDGISPTVGQRILIKDQTNAIQNGVYTVTTVGDASNDWVLTRATDFNQPSQMTAGTQIQVTSGTANAATLWILTVTVAAVGTNNVTFAQVGSSTLPAGTILQVVSANFTATASSSSATMADTGLTATITPASSSNKIIVVANVSSGADPASNGPTFLNLVRNSTTLLAGDAAGSRTSITCQGGSGVAAMTGTGGMCYLDSPATTSATTYKVQFAASNGAATVYINRTTTDGNTSNIPRCASSIILMEVKG